MEMGWYLRSRAADFMLFPYVFAQYSGSLRGEPVVSAAMGAGFQSAAQYARAFSR